jgi:hypothetical protein
MFVLIDVPFYPLFFLIEQKGAKDAKRRALCDLRDLLLKILEQKGILESVEP